MGAHPHPMLHTPETARERDPERHRDGRELTRAHLGKVRARGAGARCAWLELLVVRSGGGCGARRIAGHDSGPLRELGEVRGALARVGVAALLGLLGHVEQQCRVPGQLLDASQAVIRGVE